MERQSISIKTINGDILFGFAWECEKPEGVVVIATGMEETSYRYDDFAKFLNKNGYNVYCVDHYGQGESVTDESQLGIVPRSFFSKCVRVLDDVAKKYAIKDKPLIIFGHSMGSFMVQDFIQRYNTPRPQAGRTAGPTVAGVPNPERSAFRRPSGRTCAP